MKIRYMRMVAFACLAVLAGCDDKSVQTELCDTHELVCAGRLALSTADWESAVNRFNELRAEEEAGTASGQTCNIEYGLMLARILEGVNRLDQLLEAAALFLNGAPGLETVRAKVNGLQPAQFGDLNSLVSSFIEPFEETADKIREHARVTIEQNCVFDLYEGLPIDLGEESSLLYVSANLGYQWDSSVARTILAGVNAFQIVVNFLLAHSLAFEDLTGPLNVLIDEVDRLFTEHAGDETGTTYISVLRAAGAIPDRNPKLLTYTSTSASRTDVLPALLLEQYRAIYDRTGTTERGIIPDMVNRSREDADPTDNVLGWIDNGNNGAGANDKMIVGLRKLNLFSAIGLTDNTGGIEITFNEQFGDIDLVIEMLHQIIHVLGNQMEAVEDTSIPYPSGDYRPLGFEELNAIIDAVDILQLLLTHVPEAVRFDFREYFVAGPKAFRDLLPYWYDDDNCDFTDINNTDSFCRADVFMIEGEAVIDAPDVFAGDVSHFPDTITFNAYEESGEVVEDLQIEADGISAADIGFELPFPYIAWQDPSFNGVVLVDQTKLPVAPLPVSEAGEESAPDEYFHPADQFAINKALNAYFLYFLDPDSNAILDFLETTFGE